MTRLRTLLSTAVVLFVLALAIAFGSANGPATALIGVLAGAAVLSLQGFAGNLIAGIQLRATGDIAPGDVILIAGPAGPVTGTVTTVGARSVHLHVTADGSQIVYPNAALASIAYIRLKG